MTCTKITLVMLHYNKMVGTLCRYKATVASLMNTIRNLSLYFMKLIASETFSNKESLSSHSLYLCRNICSLYHVTNVDETGMGFRHGPIRFIIWS